VKPLVLIVEDEAPLVALLRYNLEREGFAVAEAADGEEALLQIAERRPDAVLLDWMLPLVSGIEVCRQIRRAPATRSTPVIMLTARGEEADRIRGLELGADDYVTKPFSPKELVARIAALLRRTQPLKTPATVLRYGPVMMDIDRHQVRVGDDDLRLTAKEFLLLRYLIEHRGRVLSRDLLLSDVWGYQYTGGTRTVDVHVRRLREKLPLLKTALTTVKQFGYKLEDSPPRS